MQKRLEKTSIETRFLAEDECSWKREKGVWPNVPERFMNGMVVRATTEFGQEAMGCQER